MAPAQLQPYTAQTERLCLAFLQGEIDLAATLLRLSAAESKIGNGARASELIEKAILGYKDVLRQVNGISPEFAVERTELRENLQKLFEAIVAAERELQILEK